MKKRVFIVHGWGGSPESNDWLLWLKSKLERKGFSAIYPAMPDTENPKIQSWVSALTQLVGIADRQTYLIGHSMGCQTITRYLETLPKNIKIGGAVFVAGFFKRLTGIEDEPGNDETVRHWLKTPINFKKARSHLPKSIAIFSDNDPYVSLDNQDAFRDKLKSKIIVERNMGHFNGGAGITELPIVLKSILEISN